VDTKRSVLLDLSDLFLSPLVRREFPGRIRVLVLLLPFGHLLADVRLDLGWVLHSLGAQHSHQVGDTQLGLGCRLQSQTDFLLLLLPRLATILPPDLLALLLGKEHRHVHGPSRIGGRPHLGRVLYQVGHGATLENHFAIGTGGVPEIIQCLNFM